MSTTYNKTNTYKEVTIKTASQGKLIDMLFDGAIKRAEEAIKYIENNNVELVHKNLIRAQEIITELRTALNMEIGGDLAKNIDRIYEYIHYLLVQGNLKKNTAPIKESIEYMKVMKDTWKEAFEIYQKEISSKNNNTEESDNSPIIKPKHLTSSTSTVDLTI